MKKTLAILVLSALVGGCAGDKSASARSVTRMREGYGVIIATFRYVPGKSQFPQSTVIEEAKLTCDGLAKLGYESFVVYGGGNTARVGVRAASHSLATACKKDFEKKGEVVLGNGQKIKIVEAEIVNIAELKINASDKIP